MRKAIENWELEVCRAWSIMHIRCLDELAAAQLSEEIIRRDCVERNRSCVLRVRRRWLAGMEKWRPIDYLRERATARWLRPMLPLLEFEALDAEAELRVVDIW
jgi:hypothetical protein